MDAKARIKELMQERGWSEYRLAIASGLSQSTVANIFNRNTTPSVATLESICNGFGISKNSSEQVVRYRLLTPEELELLELDNSTISDDL